MARSGGLSHLFMGVMLQQVFGQTSTFVKAAPTAAWFALSSSPVDSSGGLNEPSLSVYVDEFGELVEGSSDYIASTGYARVHVPLNDYEWWSESGVSAVVNSLEIRFPDAAQDWGTVRYWAMMSAETRGSVYAYGALRRPVKVLKGDTASVAPGGVHIALDSYDREW